MAVFEHPGPAKDPDAVTSFVGAIRALVKVKAERDAAVAAIGRVTALCEAWRRDGRPGWLQLQAALAAPQADQGPVGTETPPADSVPPTGLTEASS